MSESIKLNETLQEQVDDGFTEVVLTNPVTKEARTLVISQELLDDNKPSHEPE